MAHHSHAGVMLRPWSPSLRPTPFCSAFKFIITLLEFFIFGQRSRMRRWDSGPLLVNIICTEIFLKFSKRKPQGSERQLWYAY